MAEKIDKKANKQIKVTQTGSVIGCSGGQRKTMICLGLRKIRHSKIIEDNTSVRGMVKKVKHLVSVENV